MLGDLSTEGSERGYVLRDFPYVQLGLILIFIGDSLLVEHNLVI